MLSIHVHTSAKDAVAYHDDHLRGAAANDYYAQGDPALGRFFGRGFEHLGAKDLGYSKEAFQRLCSNLHPTTGQQLTVRKKEGARAAYDCVLSAPKSVSIMALVLDDRRVLEAHRAAVAETLDLLESRSMTRIRRNGELCDRTTGNLVGVGFEHLTSRASDPNIHEHCLIFNATFDATEERWKALQSSGIYQASGLATEVYRSTLVSKLRALGYETRRTDKAFEIAGVPQEVIDLYSKRRKQIVAIAKDLGQTNNPEAHAAIARNSRKAKDETVAVSRMRETWLDELTAEQRSALAKLKDSARKPAKHRRTSAKDALAWAEDHLFERKSVAKVDELTREAMRFARGDNTLSELQGAISARMKSKELLGRDGKVTRAQSLRDEQELLEMATRGIGTRLPFSTTFVPSPKLSEDQRAVVLKTLGSTSFVTAILGPAGAGKSTLLKSVVGGLRGENIQTTVLAPSGSAVGVLRDDGFRSAQTLQRYLLDEEMQKRSADGVVILDESSMVSLSQMLSLTRICRTNNTRVILVGDCRQMQSVEAGDAFRILLEHTKIPCASLRQIIRQRHDSYREAVSHMKDGETVRGFDCLDRIGWVHEMAESTAEQRGQRLAEKFAEEVARGKTALAVTHTWKEAAVVTEQVRQCLRSLTVIGEKEERFRVLVPRHSTQAERKDADGIGVGAVLVFRRKTKQFERGDEVRVIEVRGNSAAVSRRDGSVELMNPKKLAEHFGVYDEQDIGVSRGDKLLLRAKHAAPNGKGLTNGEIVRVKQVKDGRIVLDDGREIPQGYRHFLHGYCTSVEASQGKTVDHVYLSVAAQSAHAAGSLEGFYVAASRGRDTCTIFTDGKQELREAIKHTRARDAATELLSKKPYETRQQRKPVPLSNHRAVASAAGRYPLHRNALGRARANSLERNRDEHRRGAGDENPLPAPTVSTTHRGRRGLAHD